MGQALYRKWRPQTFDDVVGQEHIVKTLRNALRSGHIHHAYLLAGPRGTGKTTTARLIAKAVNCLSPAEQRPCNHCEICNAVTEGRLMDLTEIDAASNTGVDNIRDLLEKVGFRPALATYKVYVVDEVHMLSTQAFNALLKTLEEPPEHVIFVLATTEVHKIPETILSRCQRFEFRRIPLDALVGRLEQLAVAEGVEAEPEALDLIARTATGSMRDAISLLDQMAAGGTVTADYVRLMLGAERREVVRSLLSAWVDRDLTEGLQVINRAIDSGADPRQLSRQIADSMRGLLLMRFGAGHAWADPTAEERPIFAEMARKAEPERLVESIRRFSEVAAKQRTGWQPQLPLELAFVEASLLPTAPPQHHAPSPESAPTAPQPATQQPVAREEPKNAAGDAPRRKAAPAPALASTLHSSPPHVSEASEAPFEEPLTPASAEATAPASEKELDPDQVDVVKNNWQEIIKQVQPVNLGALLRDARVAGQDREGRLVLVFQHTFHCSKVAEQGNLRRLEDTLSRHISGPFSVRCVLEEDWQAHAPTGEVAGRPAPAKPAPSRKKPAPAVPVEEDDLIRRAQEELGAVPRVNS